MTFTGFLFVYVLGGVTFIPLLIAAVLLHAHLTFPTRKPGESSSFSDSLAESLRRDNDDEYSLKSRTDAVAEKFNRKHEADVAAGYFAVTREYVPGGVNGRPPERASPAGEVVAQESPSVYQSMYRSIFDRKEKPTIEPVKPGTKTTKRPRNIFYVVLRHGHLMLYDDAEEIEVRHVISLEYHDVSIYGGGEEIPEGELYVKRNAICLRRKRTSPGDMGRSSLPFFLFSENQSDKEDFYFALLQNQQKQPNSPDSPPEPLPFETRDIVKLVQMLHSSQQNLETRWLNALIGRLFLAMYKTPLVESFLRRKIVKKISRVKKPMFITKIVLHKLDMGDSGPFILNPRLKDLTVDGDMTVEADVKYSGNFRIEIGATARIDLGPRLKAREVDIVLAVVARKVEGHVLLRMKPPPSTRIWFTFETMPKVEMTVEPIVSTRQITYTIILRAIESRIREVIAETLVLPFWDDIPFFHTDQQQFRGGIWKSEEVESMHEEIRDEDPEDEAEAGQESTDVSNLKNADERTLSMPAIPAAPTNVKLRGKKSSRTIASEDPAASSTGVEKAANVQPPRAIRSNSFATPADPKVTTNNASAANARRDSLNTLKKDAAAAMKELSDRSLSTSPTDTPFGSPPNEVVGRPKQERQDSVSSKESVAMESAPSKGSSGSTPVNSSQVSLASNDTAPASSSTPPKRTNTLASLTGSLSGADKRQSLASITAATVAARKWGLGMVTRDPKAQEEGRPGTPDHPMGRGRPLPPPGTPLPPPARGILGSLPSLPKRKPAPPKLPARTPTNNGLAAPSKPPLPERRKQRSASHVGGNTSQEVMVVEAPTESAPATPADEPEQEFFGEMEQDVETPNAVEKDSRAAEGSFAKPALPERAPGRDTVQVRDGQPMDAEGMFTEIASETQGYETM